MNISSKSFTNKDDFVLRKSRLQEITQPLKVCGICPTIEFFFLNMVEKPFFFSKFAIVCIKSKL